MGLGAIINVGKDIEKKEPLFTLDMRAVLFVCLFVLPLGKSLWRFEKLK